MPAMADSLVSNLPALLDATKEDEDESPGGVSIQLTLEETEARRREVYRLRNTFRLSIIEIAKRVKCSNNTVCRDLKWCRAHAYELFGPQAKFEDLNFLYDTLNFYAEAEHQAHLNSMKPNIEDEFAKAQWLKLAIMARDKRVQLLQDTGRMQRQLGIMTIGLPTGQSIRAALEAAHIDPTNPKLLETIDAEVVKDGESHEAA